MIPSKTAETMDQALDILAAKNPSVSGISTNGTN
jgi:hypothetical protein